MATTKSVPKIDVSKDTSGRYYKVGGVDDEWEAKKKNLEQMGSVNMAGTPQAAGAKDSGVSMLQSNNIAPAYGGHKFEEDPLEEMVSSAKADFLPSTTDVTIDKTDADDTAERIGGISETKDADSDKPIRYLANSQGSFELGNKTWHFVSGPSGETLAWNPTTNSLDQSPGAHRAINDAFKIWEQRTSGVGKDRSGDDGGLTKAEKDALRKDKLAGTNLSDKEKKEIKEADKEYKDADLETIFTELITAGIGEGTTTVNRRGIDKAEKLFGKIADFIKSPGQDIIGSASMGTLAVGDYEEHLRRNVNPAWHDNLAKFISGETLDTEESQKFSNELVAIFHELDGLDLTDADKIRVIKLGVRQEVAAWQKLQKKNIELLQREKGAVEPFREWQSEELDSYVEFVLGADIIDKPEEVKAAVADAKSNEPVQKAVDEANWEINEAEGAAEGTAGITNVAEAFDIDHAALEEIGFNIRMTMYKDLTEDANRIALLKAIDQPISIPKGYMWDKDAGVLRYAVDTRQGDVQYDAAGQPREVGPGRVDPDTIASVTQALRLRDQAASAYEQATGENITRQGGIDELKETEASARRTRDELAIGTEGITEVDGINFTSVIDTYMTDVSAAISKVMVDTIPGSMSFGEGAIDESGVPTGASQYFALEQALMAQLPPAPPGMVWDDGSQTFKLRAGYEGRDITAETAQWMAKAAPAYKLARRANILLEQGRQLEISERARRVAERDADERFRQHMKTGEIDNAEEVIATKSLIEQADILDARKTEYLKLGLQLINTPGALVQADKHGLLAKIDAVLGTNFKKELDEIKASKDTLSLPNMQEWSGWDEETRAIFVDKWMIQTGSSVNDFTNQMSNQGMGQLQRTEWMLGPQFRN